MEFFRNINIKTRLWLIMCFMALGLLIEGGIGLSGIVMANNELNVAYKDSLEPTKMLSRIILLMGDNRAQVMLWLQHDAHSLAEHDDNPLLTHAAIINKNRDEISALVAEYKNRKLTEDEQNLADKYAAARKLYVDEGLMPAVAALLAEDYPLANQILQQKINHHYEAANTSANRLLQKILETSQNRYEQAEKRYALIRNIVIVSILLGLILGTIAAMLLINSIMKPLNRVIAHFNDISQGNLSESIDVSGGDEIGQVLRELSYMQEKLRTLIYELEHLASTDKLTGSWNRRRLEEAAKSEMNRLKRYDHPLCLMVIDIDFFKKINDSYGHGAGDQVLVELAANIRSFLRASDSLTRWGGEEFIVLCPNTTRSKALLLAERLRNKIASASFPEVEHITVSVGVAECLPEETWEQWFKRADAALYQAKSEGRNQVQVAIEVPNRAKSGEHVEAYFVQLVWHEQYECDNEVINSEHRGLFNVVNDLLAEMLSGRPTDEVVTLVEVLMRDISKHFHDEIEILAAVGYPGVTEHATLHRELMNGTVALVEKFHAGTLEIGELFNFLAHDVVAKHILGADREFFPFINQDVEPPTPDILTQNQL